MCSICRNPKCIYRFDVDKWNPKDDDGIVTIPIPESDLTFIESVRVAEKQLLTQIPKHLSLPPGKEK